MERIVIPRELREADDVLLQDLTLE
jgi:hypothetical protein